MWLPSPSGGLILAGRSVTVIEGAKSRAALERPDARNGPAKRDAFQTSRAQSRCHAWMADHNVEEGRLYVPHPDHSDRSLRDATGGSRIRGLSFSSPAMRRAKRATSQDHSASDETGMAKTMFQGVAAGCLFARHGARPGAAPGIGPVGGDFRGDSHGRVPRISRYP